MKCSKLEPEATALFVLSLDFVEAGHSGVCSAEGLD